MEKRRQPAAAAFTEPLRDAVRSLFTSAMGAARAGGKAGGTGSVPRTRRLLTGVGHLASPRLIWKCENAHSELAVGHFVPPG